jgi:hypothetical protein
MANADSVGQLYLDSFGQGRLATITATKLNTTGNAVVALPFLGGGLTKGNATTNSGQVVIRRITVCNPSGSVSSANISISTTSDGSNVIANATTLSSVSGAVTFQDVAINAGNVAVSGFNSQALFVNVGTASGNENTVDIRVYGDVVSF